MKKLIILLLSSLCFGSALQLDLKQNIQHENITRKAKVYLVHSIKGNNLDELKKQEKNMEKI